MNIKNLYTLILASFATLTFFSCEIDSFAESDEHSFGDIVAPSNIQVTADIKGQDADNPNGDGSGVVDFTVTAENAISYKFVYNGMEQLQADGTTTMNFTSLGVNKYIIDVGLDRIKIVFSIELNQHSCELSCRTLIRKVKS
jgi:hypothetical protein